MTAAAAVLAVPLAGRAVPHRGGRARHDPAVRGPGRPSSTTRQYAPIRLAGTGKGDTATAPRRPGVTFG